MSEIVTIRNHFNMLRKNLLLQYQNLVNHVHIVLCTLDSTHFASEFRIRRILIGTVCRERPPRDKVILVLHSVETCHEGQVSVPVVPSFSSENNGIAFYIQEYKWLSKASVLDFSKKTKLSARSVPFRPYLIPYRFIH